MLLSLSTLIHSCKTKAVATTDKKEVVNEKKYGINTEHMDVSVKPNDDFFRYVNGTWLDNTEIPADRTRWGSLMS